MFDGPVIVKDKRARRTSAWANVSSAVTTTVVRGRRRATDHLSMEPRLGYLIGRLDRVLRRRLAAAVEPAGLTLPAYVGAVRAAGARRPLERAARPPFARHAPVDERGAHQLVERGYVRRRADPGHGRIIRTELTDEGSRRSSAATAPSTRSSGRCSATSTPPRWRASATP